MAALRMRALGAALNQRPGLDREAMAARIAAAAQTTAAAPQPSRAPRPRLAWAAISAAALVLGLLWSQRIDEVSPPALAQRARAGGGRRRPRRAGPNLGLVTIRF